MTEYFRITGLNSINFDQGATGPYRLVDRKPPRGLSKVLTRQEVLAQLPRLPPGIRPQVLDRGLSIIVAEFNIQGNTDAQMEQYRHDLTETLEDAALFIETKEARGTRGVLRIKADGAGQDSYKTIFYGVVDPLIARDVLGSRIKAHFLEGLRLTLYCEPYWRPEDAVTLGPNEIKTPSFEEDGNADGLADNWTAFAAPVLSLENTIVLHGCNSQQVDTNALGEGIISTTMVAPAGITEVVAYAWVCRPAAGSDIAVDIRDTTAGATRDYQLLSTPGWIDAEGKGGNTWYRIVVSSNAIVPGNNHQLRIYAIADTITTFYVDKTMWIWDTTVAPDEWIGHYRVYNHNDADVDHKNYLDIDDLKGDVRLPLQLIIDPTSGASYRCIFNIARRTREYPCGLVYHVLEAEAAGARANWGNVVDATCSGGFKSSDNANAAGNCIWSSAFPSTEELGRFRVFARTKTDDIAHTQLRVEWRFSTSDSFKYNSWEYLPVVNQWDFVDLGTIYLDPIFRDGAILTNTDITIRYRKDAADLVELDFIMLLPEDESTLGLDYYPRTAAITGQHVYDNIDPFDYWAIETGDAYEQDIYKRGDLFLMPEMENRLYFAEHRDDGRWIIHHEMANFFCDVSVAYLSQFISPLE